MHVIPETKTGRKQLQISVYISQHSSPVSFLFPLLPLFICLSFPTPQIFLSSSVLLNFSPSPSVLDGKVRNVRMRSPSLLLPLHVCVCVCAHEWASRAVKVRLIHWLQQRGVERSAEFNSYHSGPLPLTNVDRLAECLLRQTCFAFHRDECRARARFLS